MERLTRVTSREDEEPFALFASWLEEAARSEPNDPNGMALSTVDADGLPNVRMVLLKGHDRDGFVFYTNTAEPEGRGTARPGQGGRAASTGRACAGRSASAARSRIVTDAEADAYFQSRPRDSRIGAWASQQSRPLESRFALEKAVAVLCREIRPRRDPAPAAIGLASASRRSISSSGATAPSACMIASSSAALRPASRGRAPAFTPEDTPPHGDAEIRLPQDRGRQAPGHAADRREPRHRPCHGDAVRHGGLAHPVLLAPGLLGEVPLAVGRRRSHPDRSRRPRGHDARHRRDQEAAGGRGRQAQRARQQCRHLAEGAERRAARRRDDLLQRLAQGLPGQFLRADHAGARPARRAARSPRARSSTSPRSPARASIPSPAPPMPPRRRRSPA